MNSHRSWSGFGRSISTALVAASLIACGGGGGGGGSGTGGTGTGGTGTGGTGTGGTGTGGTGTGGTGTGGTGTGGTGNAGNCPVNPTFQGQPGTLWVQQDTELTSFDTKDGKLLKTAAAPGFTTWLSGGLGLLWLDNVDNDKDVTPFDPNTATAFPKLGIDPGILLSPGAGMLWTIAADANANINTYSISSPSSVKSFTTNLAAYAYVATDDGLYFIGSGLPNLADLQIVHVDAANSAIVWQIDKTSVPAIGDWAITAGTFSMVVIGGKIFIKAMSAANDKMVVVDIATKTQLVAGDLTFNPADVNQMGVLWTDGTGLYTAGEGKLYEIDQTTLAAKREHQLGGGEDFISVVDMQPAAGAIWFTRRCGGIVYMHRIDTATFATADLMLPNAGDKLGQRLAYLAP